MRETESNLSERYTELNGVTSNVIEKRLGVGSRVTGRDRKSKSLCVMTDLFGSIIHGIHSRDI